MNVLITGGAGFVGSNLVTHLSLFTRYKKIGVIDNFDPFYPAEVKKKRLEKWRQMSNLHFYEADIRDEVEMEKIFQAENWDTIIHLAAVPGTRQSLVDPVLYSDVNVTGTVQMLHMAVEHKVQHFVYVSSAAVYGGVSAPYAFREDEIMSLPLSPYAASKWTAEVYCQLYQQLYGLDLTVLRMFSAFGPGQRPDMAIYQFAEQMLAGKPVTLYDPNTSRDYIYISDVVEGIRNAVDRTEGYQVYNLGSGVSVTLLQLVEILANALGVEHDMTVVGGRRSDLLHTLADISKMEQGTGFRPKVNFHEGMLMFANWFLEERS